MSATRTEVPHTAAAVRLTGLEISDCVQELNGLGQDLGKGLRTTAKTVVSAEQNLREGLTQAALAMNDIVWPAVKRRAPIVRDQIKAAASERAKLPDGVEAVRDGLASVTGVSKGVRSGATALKGVGTAVSMANSVAKYAGFGKHDDTEKRM